MKYKKILFAGLAAWMSLSSFAFDLNITKRKKHLLSIKALDDGMVLDKYICIDFRLDFRL